jgi:hypothetical protein
MYRCTSPSINPAACSEGIAESRNKVIKIAFGATEVLVVIIANMVIFNLNSIPNHYDKLYEPFRGKTVAKLRHGGPESRATINKVSAQKYFNLLAYIMIAIPLQHVEFSYEEILEITVCICNQG